jgi:hypothetical protein
LESVPLVFEITPHAPNPGVVYPYKLLETVQNLTTNIVGNNDGAVGAVVFNPALQSGATYDVWYGGDIAGINWTVVRNISGTDYATVTATMSANQTIPAITNAPFLKGKGYFTINDAKNQIYYSIILDSISSAVTSVVVKKGGKRINGRVVKSLTVSGKQSEGYWTTSDTQQPLTDSLFADFISGNLYAEVQTIKYPNGELRGQITDGMFPRADLPFATNTTAAAPITSYTEHRLPNEGFSLYGGPAPFGFKSAEQISPTRCNVVNTPNTEGTYFLVGPTASWGGVAKTELPLEFRFTTDTSWAIIPAAVPAQAWYIRVPFEVWLDTIRVWPVVFDSNNDSLWNTEGNSFVNGKPSYDYIDIVNTVDPSGNDISYYGLSPNGFPPTTNLSKAKLSNGVNHIAKNIAFVNYKVDGLPPEVGTRIHITPNITIKIGDVKRFTMNAVLTNDKESAKAEISKITVFPNPYYGVNKAETSRENRFVTFSHLPETATIRIFNLGGVHVRTIKKNSTSQFEQWDLRNASGQWVASGLYIAFIDMKELGTTTVKFAVMQEEQFIRGY